MIGVTALLLLLDGDVIVTTGAVPWLIVMDAVLPVPNEFWQTTEMVFGPGTKVIGFVFGVVVGVPLIVQVVPAGIVVAPSTVYVTLIGETVLVEPLAGEVIATPGGVPRLNVTV